MKSDGRQLHRKHYEAFLNDLKSGCKFQGLKKKYGLNSNELTKALFFVPYFKEVVGSDIPNALVFNKEERARRLKERARVLNKLDELKCEYEKKWSENCES